MTARISGRMLVGLLNTLLVASLGCVLATVIGVFAGVLRLSNNWIVARLMTVYVEIFRNVPVLLWILLAYAVLSETMPEPKDFRVTDAMIAAGQEPRHICCLTNRWPSPTAGPAFLPAASPEAWGSVDIGWLPVSLNTLAILAVLFGSFYVNRALLRHARRCRRPRAFRPVTWWKSLAIWFGPIIVLLLALGFHLEYPAIKGFNFTGGITVAHAFTALLICAVALHRRPSSPRSCAAGILAISNGQTEAAFALGLRPGRTMSLVILPQALRVIIPPLISQYLNLTKNYLARHRGGLHGPARHAGRHHAEPDRRASWNACC